MARARHMKASVVFWSAERPFVSPTNDFHKAFPEIADFEIRVEERGELGPFFDPEHPTNVSVFRPDNAGRAGEFIDCRNPRCYNGGFQLGGILRNLVYARTEEYETTEFCQGYEGSPKGRVKHGPCDNRFYLKIRLKFRDDQTGSSNTGGKGRGK